MNKRKNIVWIASYPKSGNTWFRVLLHNILNNPEQPTHINELELSNIASSRTLFDQFSGISSSDLTPKEIETLRPQVYRKLAESSDETIYMKVHDAWTLNSQGVALFPKDVTCSVIYIIRHPLDVAVSLSYHNSEDVKTSLNKLGESSFGLCLREKRLFNQLPQKLLSWSEHVRTWVLESGLRVHVIRYEDMHKQPETAFSEALKFLEIPHTAKDLENAIENSSMGALQKQEKEDGFNEKPINASSFFRKGVLSDWLNHIDQPTAKAFLEANKEIFDLFYEANYKTGNFS